MWLLTGFLKQAKCIGVGSENAQGIQASRRGYGGGGGVAKPAVDAKPSWLPTPSNLNLGLPLAVKHCGMVAGLLPSTLLHALQLCMMHICSRPAVIPT